MEKMRDNYEQEIADLTEQKNSEILKLQRKLHKTESQLNK